MAATVPLALALTMSLVLASAQTLVLPCPSTCGNTSASTLAFPPTTTEDANFGDTGTATACAAACAAFPFFQFVTGTPNVCTCYSQCSGLTDLGTGNSVYVGVSALCRPGFGPVCPTACTSAASGTAGWSAMDPAHASAYLDQPNAETCAQRCRRDGAAFYQFVPTVTQANGFNPGDCDCFYRLPSQTTCPSFKDYSPVVFVNGATCACDTQCPAPPAPSTNITVTCHRGQNCTVNGAVATQYDCTVCNTATSPGLVANNVALGCSNFAPAEPASGITPACTVPGALFPGKCLPFSFKNPPALGPPSFTAPGSPFLVSSVTVAPSGGGPLVLGPCTLTATSASYPTVLFSYTCKLTNSGLQPIRNIVLSCTNFNPVGQLAGINPDCSIPKTIASKEVCPFSFQTAAAAITFALGTSVSP